MNAPIGVEAVAATLLLARIVGPHAAFAWFVASVILGLILWIMARLGYYRP